MTHELREQRKEETVEQYHEKLFELEKEPEIFRPLDVEWYHERLFEDVDQYHERLLQLNEETVKLYKYIFPKTTEPESPISEKSRKQEEEVKVIDSIPNSPVNSVSNSSAKKSEASPVAFTKEITEEGSIQLTVEDQSNKQSKYDILKPTLVPINEESIHSQFASRLSSGPGPVCLPRQQAASIPHSKTTSLAATPCRQSAEDETVIFTEEE